MDRNKFGSLLPRSMANTTINTSMITNHHHRSSTFSNCDIDDGSNVGGDSNNRHYSTQLQPIREERLNDSNKSSPFASAQYFNLQQAIVNDTSGSPSCAGHSFNRTIVVPRTQTSTGHINPAYNDFGDDIDDLGEDNHRSELLLSPPLNVANNPNRVARQISFKSEVSNKQQLNFPKQQPTHHQKIANQKLKVRKTYSGELNKDQTDGTYQDQSLIRKDTKEKLPDWDRFVTLPPPDEDETQKSEWIEFAIRWLKLFAYFFTFFMVLLLSVCSKTLILLMTSMSASNHTVSICNNDDYYHIDSLLEHGKSYIAIYNTDSSTRVAWVWSLYFAVVAPYMFAFGRSVRIIYFKTFKVPRLQTMFTVFVVESLHCLGLSIFLFILLPEMDVIKGAMIMNSVCFIPSFIRLLVVPPLKPTTDQTTNINTLTLNNLPIKIDLLRRSFQSVDGSSIFEDSLEDYSNSKSSQSKFDHLKLAFNKRLAWINFFLQSLIILCWTFIGYHDKLEHFYLIPFALILISFEWWENYVVPDAMKHFSRFLNQVRNDLIKTRYFVFAFISPWKVLLILTIMILNEHIHNGSKVANILFHNFTDGFNSWTVRVVRDKRNYQYHVLFDTDQHELNVDTPLWPMWILFIQVSVTYLAYAFAKFTCKVCFQSISFAIPLCLTVPATISLLWAVNSVALEDKCQLVKMFKPFDYIFWNQGSLDMYDFSWFNILISLVWIVSFINQVLNTLHIWKETSERLASTEQLFVNPMYNTVMIDQSLVMNRRCLKLTFSPDDEDRDVGTGEEQQQKDVEQKLDIKLDLKLDTRHLFDDQTKINEEIFLNSELPRTSYNPMYDWNSHVDRLISESKSITDDEATSTKPVDDWTKDWHRVCEMMGVEEDSIDAKTDPADDETIRIYICATMWHEDQNEMFQMLKAVMRLDYEQGLRRIAKKEFGDDVKKCIYEMEVNIYFDDAFEQGKSDDEDDRVINRFVEQLIDTIGGSANQVFGKNLDLEPPTIVPTPYGGKLIWKMPMGTNRLIAHIKDKNLIRHRKRWSQCMYMYYLLGYRLAARKDLDVNRKKTIMNNTFVLALDGDINFRPQAVDLVVDLMKKNNNLGAACGRIHPIGSGPIVWYQKFEYAMGHWLQKATEHVIGCVLCSPGCFSLFRARALMDKSVMNKYTTKPSAAQHYVQYDQGEDRWLCTLLLQRGWRIEYCAASDSYTHAPEGFAEFYIQRRRWGPSTMANILDLLGDYKQTVKVNDNISYLYIIYQGFLMLGTIISPGTIFLMVVSAMNIVMGLSTQMSLIYNMIPLLAFMFVCLQFKDNNIKITFATILSVIYALLMLAVLVGTGIDMYTKGFFSPNSLFFSAMMASFLLAAVLHPQEFACVLPLPIYMLFIPSMYMLLTIYSITNMNVVSWGTREVKSKLSVKELAKQKEEEARAAAVASKKKLNFLNLENVSGGNKNGLFTCMCCSGTLQNDDMSGVIQEIKREVKEINKSIAKEFQFDKNSEDNNDASAAIGEKEDPESRGDKNDMNGEAEKQLDSKPPEQQRTDDQVPIVDSESVDVCSRFPLTRMNSGSVIKKPRWVRNNPRLNSWPIRRIPMREEEFWKKMISKYLYPLDEDLKEKERISADLANLRNKFVFAFAFLNIIFILFVFMLQIHKDVFGIDIPVGINGTTETYDKEEDRKIVTTNIVTTRMDPINLTLVVFFGAILIIQCIGMFIHRFGTLAHLLAYTEIHEKKKKFDYSSFVEQLIKEKTKRYGKRRRVRSPNKNRSMNVTSDEDDDLNDDGKVSLKSSDSDVKPSEYGDVVGKVIQELKSDQSQIEKMSKMMQKNTKHAIRRHEHRLHQQQLQNKYQQHRDSIISAMSTSCMLDWESSGASQFQHHRRIFQTNSNQSNSTQYSQQTIMEQQPTIISNYNSNFANTLIMGQTMTTFTSPNKNHNSDTSSARMNQLSNSTSVFQETSKL